MAGNVVTPQIFAEILDDGISVAYHNEAGDRVVYSSLSAFLTGIGKSRRHLFVYVDGENKGKTTKQVGVKSNQKTDFRRAS
jgi:hypothetical protein